MSGTLGGDPAVRGPEAARPGEWPPGSWDAAPRNVSLEQLDALVATLAALAGRERERDGVEPEDPTIGRPTALARPASSRDGGISGSGGGTRGGTREASGTGNGVGARVSS